MNVSEKARRNRVLRTVGDFVVKTSKGLGVYVGVVRSFQAEVEAFLAG